MFWRSPGNVPAVIYYLEEALLSVNDLSRGFMKSAVLLFLQNDFRLEEQKIAACPTSYGDLNDAVRTFLF